MNRILAWFLVALIFAMSGPLQAATMVSARGFEKSLYGRSAAWADKYAYCSGDPINASDPMGHGPEQLLEYLSQQVGPFIYNAPQETEAVVQVLRPLTPVVTGGARSASMGPVGVGTFFLYLGYRNLPTGPLRPLQERLAPPSGPITIALPPSSRTPEPRDVPGGWQLSGPVRPFRNYRQNSQISEKVREGLKEQYPDLNPDRWTKRFGEGPLSDSHGNEENAEFHWYDHPNAPGLRHAYKFKRWLDD